jgi:putative ABC transport system permease protein
VRKVPGVEAATWANWFGSKDPKERIPFFAGFAVDVNTWFEVQRGFVVPPDQVAAWKQTPNGVILGDALAQRLEVKVGDRLVIRSDIYQPGDWEFTVSGIYTAARKSVDRTRLILRWDFLVHDPRSFWLKEQIGWIISQISDAKQSAPVSRRIDEAFNDHDDQTLTMTERQSELSSLGTYTAILSAFDLVSVVILAIMTLILANTVAMGVRERTHEYGVLRAVGFTPGYLRGFILGESVLVAMVGGAIGIALVYLAVNEVLGPIVEDRMSQLFPYVRASPPVLVGALIAAGVIGVVAGGIPALRASRLKVTDALRRVD